MPLTGLLLKSAMISLSSISSPVREIAPPRDIASFIPFLLVQTKNPEQIMLGVRLQRNVIDLDQIFEIDFKSTSVSENTTQTRPKIESVGLDMPLDCRGCPKREIDCISRRGRVSAAEIEIYGGVRGWCIGHD